MIPRRLRRATVAGHGAHGRGTNAKCKCLARTRGRTARIRRGSRRLTPSKVTKRRSRPVDSATVSAVGSPWARRFVTDTRSARSSSLTIRAQRADDGTTDSEACGRHRGDDGAAAGGSEERRCFQLTAGLRDPFQAVEDEVVERLADGHEVGHGRYLMWSSRKRGMIRVRFGRKPACAHPPPTRLYEALGDQSPRSPKRVFNVRDGFRRLLWRP